VRLKSGLPTEFDQAINRVKEEIHKSAEVDELVRFIETSDRGVVK